MTTGEISSYYPKLTDEERESLIECLLDEGNKYVQVKTTWLGRTVVTLTCGSGKDSLSYADSLERFTSLFLKRVIDMHHRRCNHPTALDVAASRDDRIFSAMDRNTGLMILQKLRVVHQLSKSQLDNCHFITRLFFAFMRLFYREEFSPDVKKYFHHRGFPQGAGLSMDGVLGSNLEDSVFEKELRLIAKEQEWNELYPENPRAAGVAFSKSTLSRLEVSTLAAKEWLESLDISKPISDKVGPQLTIDKFMRGRDPNKLFTLEEGVVYAELLRRERVGTAPLVVD